MSQLNLRFLGFFKATANGKIVEGFESDKVRALLAYLVLESERPHRREKLCGLLWPDFPEPSARTSLRRALYNLRQVIGDQHAAPPFIIATRQTIQFNSESDFSADAVAFQALLVGKPSKVINQRSLEQAHELYRGEFLEGFSLSDCAAFEEWIRQTRESLRGLLVRALFQMTSMYEEQVAHEKAIFYARRHIELDPYQETAHQQLMRLLAANGQRNEALAHYQQLEQLLRRDLGVSPSKQTVALHDWLSQQDSFSPGSSLSQEIKVSQPPVQGQDMDGFPSGILTFLFTDIEGSTPLWEADPVGMAEALERHNDTLLAVIAAHGGRVFKTIGDAFCVVFEDPLQAVKAAVAGQRALAKVSWGRVGPLQVRMGLHYGPAVWEGDDYAAAHTFNRTARIMSCGHGGQILLSVEVVDQVRDQLPGDVRLRDLGRLQLTGMALREHLFQAVTPDLLGDFPPLKTEEAGAEKRAGQIAHNLPPPATPFIGRHEELAQLVELIADPQTNLVTIVGPGGMGKTRLALAAAEMLLENGDGHGPRFPHGVFFVALEALEAPEQIPAAVSGALGFRPAAEDPHQRSPWQQTVDYLHAKQLLLVMDNFEQLLDGVDLLVSLYHTAPQVTVLATSREKLALRGERLFPLQGLRHPTTITAGMDGAQLIERYSASRLFMESVRRTSPDFVVEADKVTDLAEICRLVGGMPLALELAAGWVELLSLGDIVAEIRNSLEVLETEMRDVPRRQRSMTAVFEGSWGRLDEHEQHLLPQLSVFRGGFTREAARQVTGVSLRQLARLAGKSLIQYDNEKDRYQIHRLLRQYLAGHLAENTEAETAARDRHSAFFCAALGAWAEDLKGARQREAVVEMEADSSNIEAAWSWAVAQRQASQLDVAVEGLVLFYARSGRGQEVEKACKQASDCLAGTTDADEQRVLAKVLVRQGWFIPDPPDAILVRQSFDLLASLEQRGYDVQQEKALSLSRLGVLAVDEEIEERNKMIAQALEIFQAAGDHWSAANSLDSQAVLAFICGSFDDARRLRKKSLLLREKIDDRAGRTRSLLGLAVIARYQGHWDEALALEDECIHIREEDHDLIGLADSLQERFFTLYFMGQFEEARIDLLKSIALSKELGLYSADDGIWLDISAIMQGEYDSFARLYPIIDDLFEEWGYVHEYLCLSLGLAAIAEGRYQEAHQLLKRTVGIYREEKRTNEMDIALSCLALAFNYLGKKSEAVSQLQEGMRINLETKSVASLWYILPAAAAIVAGLGRTERAVEVYELALQYPHVANSPLFEDIAGKQIAAVAKTLPPEVAAQARQRGRALDPWQALSEVDAEISLIMDKLKR